MKGGRGLLKSVIKLRNRVSKLMKREQNCNRVYYDICNVLQQALGRLRLCKPPSTHKEYHCQYLNIRAMCSHHEYHLVETPI